jgi:hypothetical protein
MHIDFKGSDPDLTANEKWSKCMSTNLGMATSGFPNIFFL